MGQISMLFAKANENTQKETPAAPVCFEDLNLDQVIETVTSSKKDYNLKPFFYTPLHDPETILYRQAVMQDLEAGNLWQEVQSFGDKMVVVRRYLGLVENLENPHHQRGWFLEAVDLYGEAVTALKTALSQANLKSPGFTDFRRYLAAYADSQAFTTLIEGARDLKSALTAIQYCFTIKHLTVKVRKYEYETDYSREVEATFEKFKQGAVKDYRVKGYYSGGLNHIEAQILDGVAKLFPEVFTGLERFVSALSQFLDETVVTFDREIQFYLAYLAFIRKLTSAGLLFCFPQVSAADKEIFDENGFDLALAAKRVAEVTPIVVNDFYLKGRERILVVSGPNQGGKTTFARAFGQLHYLASLGLPVPGRQARLFLPDQIFTHFEKEENIHNLRGKLQDDLVRIHAILKQATPNSIIIMNEIFTSTTLKDAVFLSQKILQQISQLDLLCVCVTFMDELSRLNEKTVSMVSTVVPDNPAVRTFKIARKSADGLAYALSIAEKYHLTYDQLKERIQA